MSPTMHVGTSLKFIRNSFRLSMYSGVEYFEFNGGMYVAIQTMSSGFILKIKQSLKSEEIISTEISVPTLLKTATPPLGVRDSIGLDLPINMKSFGHLSRMFKCVSLIMTMSNWLKSS